MLYQVILAFKRIFNYVIWIRIGVVIRRINHPIIGTVFLPSIILVIYPFFNLNHHNIRSKSGKQGHVTLFIQV